MYNGIFEKIDRILARPVRLRECRAHTGIRDVDSEYHWNFYAQSFLCESCHDEINKMMREYLDWMRSKKKKEKGNG